MQPGYTGVGPAGWTPVEQSCRAKLGPVTGMLGAVQVSGHVISAQGDKVLALDGAWNSHLDMVRCDAEGDPLADAPTTRLWTVSMSCSQLQCKDLLPL